MTGKQGRLYDQDIQKLEAIAELVERSPADVVAKILREVYFQCPECGIEFSTEDVNQDVTEIDILGVALIEFAQTTLPYDHITCPQCGENITPVCLLS